MSTRLDHDASVGGRSANGDREVEWYDAIWLAKFIEARGIIQRVAPQRLEEFVASFAPLRVPPSFSQRVVRGFLSETQLKEILEEIESIPANRLELKELKSFGRFVVHDWPAFTTLQEQLVGRVSELAEEAVEPSYNFLSLYTQRGICAPHLDAPSAKWTLDICVRQSNPWPIYFSPVVPWPSTRAALLERSPQSIQDDGVQFTKQVLEPTDAVLFSGTNQWHYRDALPKASGRAFCDLLFLHYVPRGTAELVQPKNWARLFDIAELADLAASDSRY